LTLGHLSDEESIDQAGEIIIATIQAEYARTGATA